MEPRFFGLTPENKDAVLDQVYILMKHLNFSYRDVYFLPVWKRIWFIRKLNFEIKRENEAKLNQANKTANSARSRNIFKKQF